MKQRARIMMAVAAALALGPGPGALPLGAQQLRPPPAPRGADIATQAGATSAALLAAVEALEAASSGREQVAALTATIQAYEAGLATLRDHLRQVAIRETALTLRLDAKRDRVAQLLGVLGGIGADPGPLLLLHPAGPLGTARSGMMLAEVTPAIQAEVDVLRAELREIRELREVQANAGAVLSRGLHAAQQARTALSQAIAARGPLPRRFTEDPAVLRRLIEDAETLDAVAAGLVPAEGSDTALRDFAAAQGTVPLPVQGSILRRAGEPDAAGIARPGLIIATRARALVTAPWAGTIRYLGPFLDYGNVMILEPGTGYLLVLAGLGTVYGEVGEVVSEGAALGLMGGGDDEDGFSEDLRNGTGAAGTETLYMELRKGGTPVDPGEWFANAKD